MSLNYYGRKPIYTNAESITSNNVVRILMKAMVTHNMNRSDIDTLQRYEKGDQPILSRSKDIRPEINNTIVENHAASIVNFKTGYLFGSPVNLVQRADVDSTGDKPEVDDMRVSQLNEMLFEQSKASKDQELAHNFCTTGVGYRLILPKRQKMPYEKSVFDIITLDPKNAFIVYKNNVYKDPMMAVSYVTVGDSDTNQYTNYYGVYTKDKYFEIHGTRIVLEKENPLGLIPIVEYHYDEDCMCAFEKVIPLLNSLNKTASDRQNGLEQIIQSILIILNADVDEKTLQDASRVGGLCLTGDAEGKSPDAKMLETELDQTAIQSFVDYTLEQVEAIAAVPGKTANAQNTTGEAILLSSGWQLAETAAKSEELIFKRSEIKALEIILAIFAKDNTVSEELKSLKLSDIDIKFSRNRTDGLLTKVQALQLLLQSGVRNKHAFEACGLWSDVQTVWDDSKDMILQVPADDKQVD